MDSQLVLVRPGANERSVAVAATLFGVATLPSALRCHAGCFTSEVVAAERSAAAALQIPLALHAIHAFGVAVVILRPADCRRQPTPAITSNV